MMQENSTRNSVPRQKPEQKLLIVTLLQQDEKVYQGKVEGPANQKGGNTNAQSYFTIMSLGYIKYITC
jgi:hypothetical protein